MTPMTPMIPMPNRSGPAHGNGSETPMTPMIPMPSAPDQKRETGWTEVVE